MSQTLQWHKHHELWGGLRGQAPRSKCTCVWMQSICTTNSTRAQAVRSVRSKVGDAQPMVRTWKPPKAWESGSRSEVSGVGCYHRACQDTLPKLPSGTSGQRTGKQQHAPSENAPACTWRQCTGLHLQTMHQHTPPDRALLCISRQCTGMHHHAPPDSASACTW